MLSFLLVNPPIYDFSAYDFWMKPIGLLILESILKASGHQVYFFDFMDRKSPYYSDEERKKIKDKIGGTGKFYFEEVPKPRIYSSIKRKYKRYGLKLKHFEKFLKDIEDPDFIFISQTMTYWYLGTFEVVDFLKKKYPFSRVIIGGVAANLLGDFFYSNSNVDYVLSCQNLKELVYKLNKLGIPLKKIEKLNDTNYFDLSKYKNCEYTIILTRLGCPFNCSYCAQKKLFSEIDEYSIEKVYEFILSEYERGIRHFAFYDDALLFNFKVHLKKLLDKLKKSNLKGAKFYAQNGVHVRFITKEVAEYFAELNFKVVRLSLESANEVFLKKTGFKTSRKEYETACNYLRESGFKERIETYILIGRRDISKKDIEDSVKYVKSCGGLPRYSLYSPVPYSRDFYNVNKKELLKEPLFHNNSVYSILDGIFTEEELYELNKLIK